MCRPCSSVSSPVLTMAVTSLASTTRTMPAQETCRTDTAGDHRDRGSSGHVPAVHDASVMARRYSASIPAAVRSHVNRLTLRSPASTRVSRLIPLVTHVFDGGGKGGRIVAVDELDAIAADLGDRPGAAGDDRCRQPVCASRIGKPNPSSSEGYTSTDERLSNQPLALSVTGPGQITRERTRSRQRVDGGRDPRRCRRRARRP